MLGHASAAMTLDGYADLFDEDIESVATALDAARTAAGVGSSVAGSALRGNIRRWRARNMSTAAPVDSV